MTPPEPTFRDVEDGQTYEGQTYNGQTSPPTTGVRNIHGQPDAEWRGLSRPKVWCDTCEHTHIPNIPVVTWVCADCGFGSWDDAVASHHKQGWPKHDVRVVVHRVSAASDSGDSRQEVDPDA